MSQLLFFLAGLLIGVVGMVVTGSIKGGLDVPSLRFGPPDPVVPSLEPPLTPHGGTDGAIWHAYDPVNGTPGDAFELINQPTIPGLEFPTFDEGMKSRQSAQVDVAPHQEPYA